MPGYDEELDTGECPYGNPEEPPDLDRARELIADAGASGTRVSVWGSNEEDTQAVTEAYADMLNEIGLDAEPQIVDAGVYYATVESQKTKAQTGFYTWFQDFPHPLNFYFLVDGDSIQPTNNKNAGNVDDPELDRELDRLRDAPKLKEVSDDWQSLERYLIDPDQSHLAPFGHKEIATFLSERIDPKSAIFHPLYRNDYSSWELKEGE
jgi:peptide/nickel transport system substrate-binding protein